MVQELKKAEGLQSEIDYLRGQLAKEKIRSNDLFVALENTKTSLAVGIQREKELAEVLRTDKEEVSRVGHNWRTQPGPQMRSIFLVCLGAALETATMEQATALKMALPDEWEQWDSDFDPVTGRALADENAGQG